MATVRKRKWTHNGKDAEAWVVNYTDENGKRRQKTFDKKKVADRYRAKVEVEVERGEHVPAREAVTIKELAGLYLDHLEDRLRQKTIGQGFLRLSELGLRRSILPVLGDKKVPDLSFSDMGALMRHMSDEQGLSPLTVRERRRLLIAMEGWAVRAGYAKRYTMREASRDHPVGEVEPVRIPSKEEIRRLLYHAGMRTKRQHARSAAMLNVMVNVAAFCGLRFGEICGLHPESIDHERGVISVQHNLTRFGEIKSPKTKAGRRSVPMPEHVAALLSDWHRNWAVPNTKGLLITSEGGALLTAPNFHSRFWGKLLERAELAGGDDEKRLHFHALRHFAGSLWLENGVPVTVVSELLGHAGPQITMQVYAHALQCQGERKTAVSASASAFLGSLDATRAQQENVTN